MNAFVRGMSIRDWFAGQALVGVMSHTVPNPTVDFYAAVAVEAYRYADAMLAQRDKAPNEQ